jgi:hypothetical protein
VHHFKHKHHKKQQGSQKKNNARDGAVRSTEDFKQRPWVDSNVSHGIHKHLMITILRLKNILKPALSPTIAETQTVRTQSGVGLWILMFVGITVSQSQKNHLNSMRLKPKSSWSKSNAQDHVKITEDAKPGQLVIRNVRDGIHRLPTNMILPQSITLPLALILISAETLMEPIQSGVSPKMKI